MVVRGKVLDTSGSRLGGSRNMEKMKKKIVRTSGKGYREIKRGNIAGLKKQRGGLFFFVRWLGCRHAARVGEKGLKLLATGKRKITVG